MDKSQEIFLAEHLRTLISRQKRWEDLQLLTDEDWEPFAGELSTYGNPVTTFQLKRFWNDKQPDPDQYPEVLEVLSKSQGYENWQEFIDTHQMPYYGTSAPMGAGNSEVLPEKSSIPKYRNFMWILLVSNLILLAIVIILILVK